MNFWIGYTAKYPQAFETCKASLEQFGINCYQLPSYFDPNVNTPFSRSRFLVPHLDRIVSSNTWVGYCDDDFLFLENPEKLIVDFLSWKEIYCVKHPTYKSNVKKKGSGKQVNYPMKNWSSLMFFNKDVETIEFDPFKSPIRELHRFDWVLMKDDCIGEIPIEWNWLVGEYEEGRKDLKALHYTLGGPWYGKKAHKSEYNKLWVEFSEKNKYNRQ